LDAFDGWHMPGAVDHLVAFAFGFLDGLSFAIAFGFLSLLTLSVVPWSVRVALLVFGVGAGIGLLVTAYSTYRFHRDGQAFPAIRGLFQFWKRYVSSWV
jgi:glucan phosphoethanolaminetransferase (alkaline phosphatase superfamily)